jgi:hypothetical protein
MEVAAGTSGSSYTITATITLSDGRTAIALEDVEVLDDSLTADPTLTVWDNPSAPLLTNLASARTLFGDMGYEAMLNRLDDQQMTPRERTDAVKGAYVATQWVKMFCQMYQAADLSTSVQVWNYATIYYTRWLCLRSGNPIPPGLHELFVDVKDELKQIKNGTLFIADIGIYDSPEASWSNLRLDDSFAVRRLRVERGISDRSATNGRVRRDWASEYFKEPDF